MWLLLLFVALPLTEIGLFVTLGGWLTLWPTLAIVLGSAALGMSVLPGQGLRAIADLQAAQAAVSDPLSPLAHRGLLMLAGLLLILPGFFTDAVGLLLLIPIMRRILIGILAQKLRAKVGFGGLARSQSRRGDDAHHREDAEFVEIAPDAPRPPPHPPRRDH